MGACASATVVRIRYRCGVRVIPWLRQRRSRSESLSLRPDIVITEGPIAAPRRHATLVSMSPEHWFRPARRLVALRPRWERNDSLNPLPSSPSFPRMILRADRKSNYSQKICGHFGQLSCALRRAWRSDNSHNYLKELTKIRAACSGREGIVTQTCTIGTRGTMPGMEGSSLVCYAPWTMANACETHRAASSPRNQRSRSRSRSWTRAQSIRGVRRAVPTRCCRNSEAAANPV